MSLLKRRLATVAIPLCLLLCSAAAIRLAFIREVLTDQYRALPKLEQGRNLAWARAAASGDWSRQTIGDYPLANLPDHPYVHPPGYPSLIAGLYRIFQINSTIPLVFQMLLGLWTTWLAWYAARRWISASAGWLAALMSTFHWSAVYYTSQFLDANLLTTLTTTAVVAVLLLGDALTVNSNPRTSRRRRWLQLSIPALAAGLAAGLAAIVRPAAAVLIPVICGWLLWVVWRYRNPSLRMAAADWMAENMAPAGQGALDVSSDVLLEALQPSASHKLRAALHDLPATFRQAGTALLFLLLGLLLAIGPVTWRNLRAGGFVPISVGENVAALAAAMPEAQSLNDCEFGVGARLDRLADYELLAAAAGSDRPRSISRHFRRERRTIFSKHPENFAKNIARRLALFWGPIEVGTTRVVESDRLVSPVLTRLPLPFSILNTLSLMGFAFWIFPRRERIVPTLTAQTATDLPAAGAVSPVNRALPLLLLGIFVCWTLSHLKFLAAGIWRQPLLPLVAIMAAFALADLGQNLLLRRWSEVTVWVALLFCIWLVAGRNLGQYVPNHVKWQLDRALALEERGQEEAAVAAYRVALLSAPGVVDPQSGVISTGGGVFAEADSQRMRSAAGVAAARLGRHFYTAGNRKAALQYYQLAGELNRRDNHSLLNVGLLQLREGNHKKAEEALRSALQRDAGAWVAYYPLAQALYQQGRYDEARTELEKLLTLKPDHRSAQNLLSLIAPQR